MARGFLIVLDSVGIGGAPDAAEFGDAGADTLGHIAQACASGQLGRGPLDLRFLPRLGLGAVMEAATGQAAPSHWPAPDPSCAFWAAAREYSPGKDTPSGHWELAGVPVPWDWQYYPDETPAFPAELMARVAQLAGTEGSLANCLGSGTDLINRFGAEHLRSGWPICYSSADSVFQIAAHEQSFGLDRLLQLCEALAPELHAQKVGRVIARPFIGSPGNFTRTTNRRDYAIAPPQPTLCDWVQAEGRAVHGIGKIRDIFSGQGIDSVAKGSDAELMQHLTTAIAEQPEGSLTFANFVEFDSLYGHRRDIAGYAAALEWVDRALEQAASALAPDDLMILCADHGNDPSWPGTDHTREMVPVLGYNPQLAQGGARGICDFVDVAASMASHLGLSMSGPGRSLL
ncbi:MAG: phosphopentomutase [Mangrovicoccus sp.]